MITGASSGIGAACARHLAAAGFDLLLGARRTDRLEAVAGRIAEEADAAGRPAPTVRVRALDVADAASVVAFAAGVDRADVLLGNAGGALGLDPAVEITDEQWTTMFESNVLGLVRTVRAFLPALRASGDGRIVGITSVAGSETYPGGAGYTAAKHGAVALLDTLRVELLAEPVRVIDVAPGLVETEFSTVRFDGDAERAAGVYAGLTPLSADDVADVVTFAVTRPAHVVTARITLLPSAQAGARDTHRAD